MAGVRARHARPRLGAPHLERHDGLALGVGGLEGTAQLGGVLEPFEVAGDHGGVVVVGEVLDEVRRLEVELVARRHPPAERHAEFRALDERAALVPALGHEPDAAPAPAGRLGQDLECVGVGVGTEDTDAVAARHLTHLALELGAGRAHLAEARREDQDVGDAVLAALLHRLRHQPGAHVDDRQRDLGRDVGDVLVHGDVADGAPLGVHEVPPVPPALAVAGAQPLGLGVAVHRPHESHSLGVEEFLEVDPPLRRRCAGRRFAGRCCAGRCCGGHSHPPICSPGAREPNTCALTAGPMSSGSHRAGLPLGSTVAPSVQGT